MNVGAIGLWAAVAFPLLGSIMLALIPWRAERNIARIAQGATTLSSLSAAVAIFFWVMGGFQTLETVPLTLVTSGSYHFSFALSLDLAAAGFLFLVEFTSGTVIRFSRVYLHRETGYRRFFSIVLMFEGGMALLTLASNLDLLFCGWELVGLSSFLLIAFYHERAAPVRNALKTFSIYRVADLGMFLGAFLEHTSPGTGVGLLLLLAAAGKSAQFPFSFWIVRAMEGPTPSSALFYGALSVHAGAYLLLRTYSVWGGIPVVHLSMGLLGLCTAVLCSMFSRVQHTVKGQIGYASATQVGFIFVELALGLKGLALFHMVSNALLRCYQLLISPSAVAYLLRQQSSSNFTPPSEQRSLFQRLLTREGRSSLFVFAVSEGYIEEGLRTLFWLPLRTAGSWISRNRNMNSLIVYVLVLIGVRAIWRVDGPIAYVFSLGLFIGAVSFSLAAISSATRPLASLVWLGASCIVATASVFVSSQDKLELSGFEYIAAIGLMCGIVILAIRLVTVESEIPRMAGLGLGRPLATWVALFGALGIAGFPLLPTFFGEDILMNAAFRVNPIFAFGLSGLFALNGYVAVRGFALSFFGPQREA